jgi:mono/diheme cytochrome c family protein
MSRSEKSPTRRDFLRNMVALVPTFSIAACAPLSALRTSPAQAYSPRYFNREEWDFLHAACARLIPADENGPGAVELGVPEFIDREADSAMQASAASAATRALRAGDTGMRGSRVNLDNCNACHRSDGSGANRTFPNLVKNEAVNANDPISLIHIVLAGASMPSTQTAPSALAMPDFGWRLSDTEVEDVVSFVRSSWGNDSTAVTLDEVGRVRKTLAVQKAAR